MKHEKKMGMCEMNPEWIEVRLDRINKKLATLETALLNVSMGLESFIEDKQDNIDSVIYGQETVEGTTEILGDIRNDLNLLVEQVKEEREKDFPKFDLGQGKDIIK